MTEKERLLQYINEDEVYNLYKQHKLNFAPNDFELFCIEHCKDIETILNENEDLKEKNQQLKVENQNIQKYLNRDFKINLNIVKKQVDDLRQQNQELKDRDLIIAMELEKKQQENQKLKEDYNKAIHDATEFASEVYESESIINELRIQVSSREEVANELKERIEKAIGYIESSYKGVENEDGSLPLYIHDQELLEILKGV